MPLTLTPRTLVTPLDQAYPIPLAQFTTNMSHKQPNSQDPKGQFTAQAWCADMKAVLGAYIHVPFCFHKCHYCDFFSIAGAEDQHHEFVSRLKLELAAVEPYMEVPLQSIFIGGGTPTLLAPALFDEMLYAIETHLHRSATCEWTIEANPETVTEEIAQSMIAHGVNRVSIGAQSFDETLLKTLERWHDPKNVAKAMQCLRDAGIKNINLDLIYAIPNQTTQQVEHDLRTAISLKPEHLSCYALIYEPNTPLRTKLDKGQVVRVDPDEEASMFGLVRDTLSASGFTQYEISNFAREGYACQHNLMYWKNQSWWPFGPAASGHLNGIRWRNKPRLSEYLLGDGLPPIEDVESLGADQRAGEVFMVGLRVLEGMERDWVETLIEQSTDHWRKGVIDGFIEEGLLHWIDNKLALTPHGILIADSVILALLMYDQAITDTTGKS